MLPYIEQRAISNSINFNFGLNWTGASGNSPDFLQATAMNAVIGSFICPSDSGKGRNSYRSVNGTNWDWWSREFGFGALTRPQPGGQSIGTIAGITDGTSNTLAFLERIRGDNDSSRYSPGDVYQGGNGSQWGMPTCVVSNPADFLSMRNTVIPECVAYAKAHPTATWDWGGFYWAAGEYTTRWATST